jgi:hypothetical protein
MLSWRTWIAAAAAALLFVAAQPAWAGNWVQYLNKKYSFSVCYPEDLFGEDENINKQIREEEGRADTSEDGFMTLDTADHSASLSVYGDEMGGHSISDERDHLAASIPYTAHIVSRLGDSDLISKPRPSTISRFYIAPSMTVDFAGSMGTGCSKSWN